MPASAFRTEGEKSDPEGALLTWRRGWDGQGLQTKDLTPVDCANADLEALVARAWPPLEQGLQDGGFVELGRRRTPGRSIAVPSQAPRPFIKAQCGGRQPWKLGGARHVMVNP